MRAYVARITEVNPLLRRIHVVGEVHPGELEARGYVKRDREWIKEIRRPKAGGDADPFVNEFAALCDLGYAFLEGEEWAPAELYRRAYELGALKRKAAFMRKRKSPGSGDRPRGR